MKHGRLLVLSLISSLRALGLEMVPVGFWNIWWLLPWTWRPSQDVSQYIPTALHLLLKELIFHQRHILWLLITSRWCGEGLTFCAPFLSWVTILYSRYVTCPVSSRDAFSFSWNGYCEKEMLSQLFVRWSGLTNLLSATWVWLPSC